MQIRKKAKNKAKSKLKKIAFKIIKPFLPFIILFFAIFFAICTIIDAVFIQEVQTDSSLMSEVELDLKNKCIEKAEFLNTCHNFIGEESTNNLLDVNDREKDKEIQWSHLYAIMAFHNMSNNKKMNESLLNDVAKSFESTFRYEKDTKIIKVDSTDALGNPTTETKEEVHYILVESDTIMGHYKYNYEDGTNGKVFAGEELIGKKYERLENYLKKHFHIKKDEIDSDIQVIIQAANGYYNGEENTSWLSASYTNQTTEEIINDGDVKASKGMFTWPIPGHTKVTSHFGMRVHPITGVYKLHTGTDISAPIGAKFVAMADGTVVNASYNRAYGNMVMIDHGGGIVTLYAHGSEIMVKTNQVVKKGQVVLKVGSTGYSTGPHAHFEVRINGKYTNPEDYFD